MLPSHDTAGGIGLIRVLVIIIAFFSSLALIASALAILLFANETNAREADRRENVNTLCSLLNEVTTASNQQTDVLVGLLRQGRRDIDRFAALYRSRGIDPETIKQRSERASANLEGAQLGTLACVDGAIKRGER